MLVMPAMFEDEKVCITEFEDIAELREWADLNNFKPEDYAIIEGVVIEWEGNKQ